MRYRTATIIASLALAAGIIAFRNWGRADLHDGGSEASSLMSPPERQLVRSTEVVVEDAITQIDVDEATAAAASLIAARFGESAAGPGQQAPESDCEWPSDWKRASDKIVLWMLLKGRDVPASYIARWRVLNPSDQALCRPDRVELEQLCLFARKQVAPMADACRRAVVDEREEVVKAGGAPRYAPSKEAVEAAVARHVAGQSRLGREISEEQAREELAGHITPPVGTSYMMVGGRVYLHRDFPPLPRSEGQFEHVKFLVTQEIMGYAVWLDSRGIRHDEKALNATLERIAGLSLKDLSIL